LNVRFYLAGLIVVLVAPLCGAHLLTFPGFLPLVLILILAGFPVSLWLRWRKVSRTFVNRVVTLAASVSGLLLLWWHPQSFRLLGEGPSWPTQLLYGEGLGLLIHFIAWILACRCFTLVTDLDVVLMIVPSLSLLILVTILAPTGWVLSFLGPFAVAALYLLMLHHHQVLHRRADEVIAGREGVREWQQDARTLGTLCGLISVAAFFLSVTLADSAAPRDLVNHYGLQLATRLSQWLLTATQRTYVSFSNQLDVGEASTPESGKLLFRVRSEQAALWRGNVYSTYDGRSWHAPASLPLRRAPFTSGQKEWVLPPNPDEPQKELPGARLRQEFEIAVPHFGILFAAYNPISIAMNPRRGGVLKVDEFRRLQCGVIDRGERYVVTSVLKGKIAQSLRACPPAQGPTWALYLTVPETVPERVKSLARALCQGTDNAFDRLQRLMSFLGDNYAYTRYPPPIPPERDVVDYFLFEREEGHCQHFASALAILARCVGVPTRLVAGYTCGPTPTQTGWFEVTEKEAHAWVEAYFPGLGWYEYDPTSMAKEAASGWAKWVQTVRQKARQWALAAGKRLLVWGSSVGEGTWRFLLILLGVASVSSGVGLLIHRWGGRVRLPPRPLRDPQRSQACRSYEAFCRLLARAGIPRQETQTPFEHRDLVLACFPDLGTEIGPIVQTYVQSRYAPEPPAPAEIAASAAALRGLRSHLRAARKWKPPLGGGRKRDG